MRRVYSVLFNFVRNCASPREQLAVLERARHLREQVFEQHGVQEGFSD